MREVYRHDPEWIGGKATPKAERLEKKIGGKKKTKGDNRGEQHPHIVGRFLRIRKKGRRLPSERAMGGMSKPEKNSGKREGLRTAKGHYIDRFCFRKKKDR